MDCNSKKNSQDKSIHLGTHSVSAWGRTAEGKSSIAIFTGVLLMIFFASSSVFSQPIELNVSYSFDDFIFSKLQGYDLIEVEGEKTSLVGFPGEPWLPAQDFHVLLPMGMEVSGVDLKVLECTEIPGEYLIYPSQMPSRVSGPDSEPFVEPISAIYDLDIPVPLCTVEVIDTLIIHGYYVAVVRVNPITYIPTYGKLFLTSRMNITLHLMQSPEVNLASLANTEEVFEEMVGDDVVNPEDVDSEYGTVQVLSPVDMDDVKYLIVTAENMVAEFQPLVDWKTKKGVPAQAVSVDWIYSNYTGADNQEKIKKCIKDYADNKGTVWVLLGGDNTIVPDRNCYTYVSSYSDSTIPTDLYYSGLDDMDWNDDGDSKCGEVTDDSIDMGPDVFVGRFPARTESHITAMVNKTIDYEKNSPSSGFAEKMVLTGVKLWNTGDAESKSEIMYDSYIDPYWGPIRKRFYDTATDFSGGSSYNVTALNIMDVLENGYNFFHMATHGGVTVWGVESGSYYSSAYAMVTPNSGKYTNVLTIACLSNGFDYSSDPCLSEGFLRNPNGGAVTFIGCSRYGWGYSTMTSHGPSFRYDRMFYKFLFTGEPSGYAQHVGAVYARMKSYWSGSSSYDGAMRWCQFGINLMGDPELCLYTSDPLTFTPGQASFISAVSQSLVIETGVSEALVCISKGSEVYEYGTANGSGSFTATVNPTTQGTLNITITAPNYYPYEGTIDVVAIPDEDNYEENDLLVEAYDFTSGDDTWLSSDDGIGISKDDDWYKIQAGMRVRTIQVYCQFTNSAGNIDITLCNSSGAVLASSISSTDNEYISFDIPSSDIYYVRVYGAFSGNGYDLHWKTVEGSWPPVVLSTTAHDTWAKLEWSNPEDSGYNSTVYLRRSTTGYPSNSTDGVEIFRGTTLEFIDTGLTPGETYYYKLWVNDGAEYAEASGDSTVTAVAKPTIAKIRIFFEHTRRTISQWLLEADGTRISRGGLGTLPRGYTIVTIGDIDADGTDDFIIRYRRTIGFWLLNDDGTFKSSGTIGSASTTWRIEETADINGDGSTDIIFRNKRDGRISIWFLDPDGSKGGRMSVGRARNPWAIVGCGDINGDGTADIIFRNNRDGRVVRWFLNPDGAKQGSGTIGKPSLVWRIRKTADIDGDGTIDIIFRNKRNGRVVCWFLNPDGTKRGSSKTIGTMSTRYSIRGVGDIDSNGSVDLIWRHKSGYVHCWLLNSDGTIKHSGRVIDRRVSTKWHIAGCGE